MCTEYVISMPNMYARGILWGKMFLELGDSCTAKNEQTGHYAEIQFKTKVAVVHVSFIVLHRLHSPESFVRRTGILLGDIQRHPGAHTAREQRHRRGHGQVERDDGVQEPQGACLTPSSLLPVPGCCACVSLSFAL